MIQYGIEHIKIVIAILMGLYAYTLTQKRQPPQIIKQQNILLLDNQLKKQPQTCRQALEAAFISWHTPQVQKHDNSLFLTTSTYKSESFGQNLSNLTTQPSLMFQKQITQEQYEHFQDKNNIDYVHKQKKQQQQSQQQGEKLRKRKIGKLKKNKYIPRGKIQFKFYDV